MKSPKFGISTSLSDAQVREKLVHQGAATLSDAELLSILLARGEGGLSALGLAERLLEGTGGSLVALGLCPLKELRLRENLGVNRAVSLLTALELGRRYRSEESSAREAILSDQDVIGIFQPQLSGLPHEEFWVVYLNAANRILEKVRISQGGVSGTVVDFKLIVKRALEQLASSIVLVHNHPSGNPAPSDSDRRITQRLHRGAALFDIRVLDHVIVTAGRCHSFRSTGFFEELEQEEK